MATRAIIGVRRNDGSIISSQLQNDGFPESTGEILKQEFNTEAKALELISFGDMSVLDWSIEATDFYHRDYHCGWRECEPREFQNLEEFKAYIHKYRDFEFSFLFESGAWRWDCVSYSKRTRKQYQKYQEKQGV